MTLKEKVALRDRRIAQLELDNRHLLVKIEEAQEAAAEIRAAIEEQTLLIVSHTRGEARARILDAGDQLALRLHAQELHLSLAEC